MAGLQTWPIGPKNASSNVVGTPGSDVMAGCIAPGDSCLLLDVAMVVDSSAGGVVPSDLNSLVILDLDGLGSSDVSTLSCEIPNALNALVSLGGLAFGAFFFLLSSSLWLSSSSSLLRSSSLSLSSYSSSSSLDRTSYCVVGCALAVCCGCTCCCGLLAAFFPVTRIKPSSSISAGSP
jgi:hypothetical protein